VEPLYTMDDVNLLLPMLQSVEYDKPYTISEQVELLFTEAGHIIGSAAVNLKIKENNILQTLTFS